MPRRYWVAMPGRPEPTRMELGALVEAHRAHLLPAGTAARVWRPTDTDAPSRSESEQGPWIPLDELPELRPSEVVVAGGPSSQAAQGVVVGDWQDGAPSTRGLSIGAEPAPTPAPQPKAAPNPGWTLPRWSHPWLLIVPLLGAITLLVGWLYGRYPRGLVLEHLPDDCARLDYLDLAAIDEHLVSRSDRSAREHALRQLGAAQLDAEEIGARVATIGVLEHAGLHPYGSIVEAAYCELKAPGDRVVVVGGSFDAVAALTALQQAMLRRDPKANESTYVLQALENRPTLRIGHERVATAVGRHLLVVGPPRVVSQLFRARSVAKTYGIEHEVLVRLTRRNEAESAGGTFDEERFEISGNRLQVRRRWTTLSNVRDPAAEVRVQMVSTAQQLRGSSVLAGLADGLADARVQVHGNEPKERRELETEHFWPLEDVRQAVHGLIDAETRTSTALIRLLATVQGGEVVRMAVVPGVDYLDLRLSPW